MTPTKPTLHTPCTKRAPLRRISACAMALSMLAVGACEKDPLELPVDKTSIALTAQNNVINVTKNLTTSLGFLAESDSVAGSLNSFGECSVDASEPLPGPVCDVSDPTCVEPVVDPAPVETSTGCDTASMKQDLAQMNTDLQEEIDKFVAKLKAEIFTAANVESESDTEIVYKVPLSVMCDDSSDTDCVDEATRGQYRLRVTSPSEGDLDVGILMTAMRYEAFVVKLYHNRLAVSADLAAIKNAMAIITPDDSTEITRASGVVELALVKNADRDFSLVGEVSKAIDIALTEVSEDGAQPQTVTFKLDASDKTYEVRLDGVKKTVSASINFGAFRLSAPLSGLGGAVGAGEAMSTTDLYNLVLGGLNGAFTFDGSTDLLNFKQLGLGNETTAVSVNGNQVFSLDVNKNSGRRFDMSVSMADSDSPTMTFDPGLSAAMKFNFSSIANRFESLPSWALNETIAFDLTGTKPAIRINDAGLEVVSGTLRFSSTAVPAATVVVNAGQCMISSDVEPVAPAHDLLSSFSAGACQ
jgi:hypothetical protein